MLHPDQWHLAPHPIQEIAAEVVKEGVFTGIAWDANLGWTILQRQTWEKPPIVAWSERKMIQDALDDIDIDNDDIELD